MNEMIIHLSNFPLEYLEKIKEDVRNSDPLICATQFEDNYNLEHYMLLARNHKFRVLIDNNIFTRLVYLSKGNEIKGTPEEIKTYKLCSSIMCFFILSEFSIEPNIALYERASINSHLDAIDDIKYFRVADHIIPKAYAELALGISTKFTNEDLQEAQKSLNPDLLKTKEKNFNKYLDDWKLAYLHLLKMINIEKHEQENTTKIEVFFDWLNIEASLFPITVLFSILFFSPKRSNVGTMI